MYRVSRVPRCKLFCTTSHSCHPLKLVSILFSNILLLRTVQCNARLIEKFTLVSTYSLYILYILYILFRATAHTLACHPLNFLFFNIFCWHFLIFFPTNKQENCARREQKNKNKNKNKKKKKQQRRRKVSRLNLRYGICCCVLLPRAVSCAPNYCCNYPCGNLRAAGGEQYLQRQTRGVARCLHQGGQSSGLQRHMCAGQ